MTNSPAFSIELTPDQTAETVNDLVQAITEASDAQVTKTRLRDDEDETDFRMSCDALNFWRILLRLREDSHVSAIDSIERELPQLICEARGYDRDEFESTKHATEKRVRSPFGLDPLRIAVKRASRESIRLLHPDVAESELATTIAGIARQLQKAVGEDKNIFLPIEQLREIIGKRKTVVSGTVMRLVKAGLIAVENSKYHTNRAREFRFIGEIGEHFEVESRGQT